MIKPATILDLAAINELMSTYEGRDCHEFIRGTLLNKDIYWFHKKNSAIVYVPEDNGRYQMHIYNKAKGDKSLAKWCISTGEWIFDNTEAQVLINYVEESRRDLRFFMLSIGSKKRCKVGNDILYTYDRQDYIGEE